MTPGTRNRKTAIVALGFGLFGVTLATSVFTLTEDRFRRMHALIIGAINIGVALYLGRRTRTEELRTTGGTRREARRP
jgi:hypothetical protein